MSKELNDKDKKIYIDKHLTKIYPQLKLNMIKVCGAGEVLWADDLLSTAVEFFLNKDIEVQYDSCINNKAENFITYMANFQLKSGTSKFFHTHRKFSTKTRDYFTDYVYDRGSKVFEDDDRTLCIKEAIKELDPFERMIVDERMIKKMKFNDIADRYDIPYSSLAHNYRKIKNKIKERCKHLQQYL